MPSEVVPLPKGRVRAHRVRPTTVRDLLRERKPDPAYRYIPRCWEQPTEWQHNDVLYEWATIVGHLLLRVGTQYGIAGMYMEFENVADPEDVVSPPSVTRDADQGVEYYNALALNATKDYLRVPLIAGVINRSDDTKFPAGNLPTFFAQTTGNTGVHGKPFSYANNSKMYGGALVAFVDEADATRDLVFSRFYFDTDKQQPKLDTSQVGYEWEIVLE